MKKKTIATVLLSFMTLCARADSINLPSLGESSSMVLSNIEERQIGQEIMREIKSGQFGMAYFADPEVNDYIRQLGNRLVKASDIPNYPIEFFIVDDMSINAMAFLGGFIGIHTGLIISAQTESELASVMAHEIAHITQRHIARSIMRQQQAQPFQVLALLFALAISGNSPGTAGGIITGTMAGSTQLFLNYSRDFEREADRIGFRTIERAGFNAADYAVMFERMHRNTRMHDSGFYPAYLRTHPMTFERVADIQNLLGDKKTTPVADSVGFHLIRIKLQVMRMSPRDAVTEYEKQLVDRRYLKEYAARYGAAYANVMAKNYAAARNHLDWLKDNKIDHSMIRLLSAKVLRGKGRIDEAVAVYQEALKRFPSDFAVIHDMAATLLAAARYEEVIDTLAPKMVPDVSDVRLYRMLAQAYQKLDRTALYHGALAEAYAGEGNYHDAIVQLELAQKGSGANFYDQSIQDSRLREFRRRFKEMRDSRS